MATEARTEEPISEKNIEDEIKSSSCDKLRTTVTELKALELEKNPLVNVDPFRIEDLAKSLAEDKNFKHQIETTSSENVNFLTVEDGSNASHERVENYQEIEVVQANSSILLETAMDKSVNSVMEETDTSNDVHTQSSSPVDTISENIHQILDVGEKKENPIFIKELKNTTQSKKEQEAIERNYENTKADSSQVQATDANGERKEEASKPIELLPEEKIDKAPDSEDDKSSMASHGKQPHMGGGTEIEEITNEKEEPLETLSDSMSASLLSEDGGKSPSIAVEANQHIHETFYQGVVIENENQEAAIRDIQPKYGNVLEKLDESHELVSNEQILETNYGDQDTDEPTGEKDLDIPVAVTVAEASTKNKEVNEEQENLSRKASSDNLVQVAGLNASMDLEAFDNVLEAKTGIGSEAINVSEEIQVKPVKEDDSAEKHLETNATLVKQELVESSSPEGTAEGRELEKTSDLMHASRNLETSVATKENNDIADVSVFEEKMFEPQNSVPSIEEKAQEKEAIKETKTGELKDEKVEETSVLVSSEKTRKTNGDTLQEKEVGGGTIEGTPNPKSERYTFDDNAEKERPEETTEGWPVVQALVEESLKKVDIKETQSEEVNSILEAKIIEPQSAVQSIKEKFHEQEAKEETTLNRAEPGDEKAEKTSVLVSGEKITQTNGDTLQDRDNGGEHIEETPNLEFKHPTFDDNAERSPEEQTPYVLPVMQASVEESLQKVDDEETQLEKAADSMLENKFREDKVSTSDTTSDTKHLEATSNLISEAHTVDESNKAGSGSSTKETTDVLPVVKILLEESLNNVQGNETENEIIKTSEEKTSEEFKTSSITCKEMIQKAKDTTVQEGRIKDENIEEASNIACELSTVEESDIAKEHPKENTQNVLLVEQALVKESLHKEVDKGNDFVTHDAPISEERVVEEAKASENSFDEKNQDVMVTGKEIEGMKTEETSNIVSELHIAHEYHELDKKSPIEDTSDGLPVVQTLLKESLHEDEDAENKREEGDERISKDMTVEELKASDLEYEEKNQEDDDTIFQQEKVKDEKIDGISNVACELLRVDKSHKAEESPLEEVPEVLPVVEALVQVSLQKVDIKGTELDNSLEPIPEEKIAELKVFKLVPDEKSLKTNDIGLQSEEFECQKIELVEENLRENSSTREIENKELVEESCIRSRNLEVENTETKIEIGGIPIDDNLQDEAHEFTPLCIDRTIEDDTSTGNESQRKNLETSLAAEMIEESCLQKDVQGMKGDKVKDLDYEKFEKEPIEGMQKEALETSEGIANTEDVERLENEVADKKPKLEDEKQAFEGNDATEVLENEVLHDSAKLEESINISSSASISKLRPSIDDTVGEMLEKTLKQELGEQDLNLRESSMILETVAPTNDIIHDSNGADSSVTQPVEETSTTKEEIETKMVETASEVIQEDQYGNKTSDPSEEDTQNDKHHTSSTTEAQVDKSLNRECTEEPENEKVQRDTDLDFEDMSVEALGKAETNKIKILEDREKNEVEASVEEVTETEQASSATHDEVNVIEGNAPCECREEEAMDGESSQTEELIEIVSSTINDEREYTEKEDQAKKLKSSWEDGNQDEEETGAEESESSNDATKKVISNQENLSTVGFIGKIETEGAKDEETPTKNIDESHVTNALVEATKDETVEKHEEVPAEQNHETNVEKEATKIDISTGAETTKTIIDILPTSLASKESSKNKENPDAAPQEEILGIEKQEESSAMVSEELKIAVGEEDIARGIIKEVDVVENLNNAFSESRSVGVVEEKASGLVPEEHSLQIADSTEMETLKDDEDICHIVDTSIAKIESIKESAEKGAVAEKRVGTNDKIDLDIPIKTESERVDINPESKSDMRIQKTEADMETTSIEVSQDDENTIDVSVYPQASLQESTQNEAFAVTTKEHSKEVEEVSTNKREEHEKACELESVDNSESIEAGENNEEENIETQENLNTNPAENRTESEHLENPTHMVLEGVEKIDVAESIEKQINTVPVAVVVEEVTDEEKNVVTNLDQEQIDSRPKDQNYRTEEANDTIGKEIPDEEAKESNLQSQERELQMAPTEKTETVILRDDHNSDLILDVSPAIIKTTEEALQVGDQLEKASNVGLEEKIHEAIDANEKDIEVVKPNISSQEGQINVELKDTYHDLVSAQETNSAKESNLQSEERDLQMAPTEKTETVILREDDNSDLILDASPAIIKTTEEAQVGDQLEKASNVRLEEQIHEAIDENEKDIEVAKANISSREGQINVELKDTYHDLVSAQETTNASDTTKATTPSVNEALGDADTSCVAHASVLHKEGGTLALDLGEEELELKVEEQNYGINEENDITENKISDKEMSMGFQGEGVALHFDTAPLRVQTVESLQEGREGKKLEGPELEAENQTFEMDTEDDSLADKNLLTVGSIGKIETEGAKDEETPTKSIDDSQVANTLVEATKDETIEKQEEDQNHETNVEEEATKIHVSTGDERTERVIDILSTSLASNESSKNEEISNAGLQEERLGNGKQEEYSARVSDKLKIAVEEEDTVRGIIKQVDVVENLNNALSERRSVGVVGENDHMNDIVIPRNEEKASDLVSEEHSFQIADSTEKTEMETLKDNEEILDIVDTSIAKIESIKESAEKGVVAEKHVGTNDKIDLDIPINTEPERLDIIPESKPDMSIQKTEADMETTSIEVSLDDENPIDVFVYPQASMQENTQNEAFPVTTGEHSKEVEEVSTTNGGKHEKACELDSVDNSENIEVGENNEEEMIERQEIPNINPAENRTESEHLEKPTLMVLEGVEKIDVAESIEKQINTVPVEVVVEEVTDEEKNVVTNLDQEQIASRPKDQNYETEEENDTIGKVIPDEISMRHEGEGSALDLNNRQTDVDRVEEKEGKNIEGPELEGEAQIFGREDKNEETKDVSPNEEVKESNLQSQEKDLQMAPTEKTETVVLRDDNSDLILDASPTTVKTTEETLQVGDPLEKTSNVGLEEQTHETIDDNKKDIEVAAANISSQEGHINVELKDTFADLVPCQETTDLSKITKDTIPSVNETLVDSDTLCIAHASVLQKEGQKLKLNPEEEQLELKPEEKNYGIKEENDVTENKISNEMSMGFQGEGVTLHFDTVPLRVQTVESLQEGREGKKLEGPESEAENQTFEMDTKDENLTDKNLSTVDFTENIETEDANEEETPSKIIEATKDETIQKHEQGNDFLHKVEENLEEKEGKNIEGPELEAETQIFGREDTNDENKDVRPNEEVKESNLQSQEKDLQMVPTEKKETVILRDDNSDLILDASPTIVKTTEETSQVGDQLEKTSNVGLEEQTHEAIDDNKKDIEVAAANISSQEGHINVELKDTFADLVSSQETTALNKTTKDTTPSVNETLGDSDTLCVAHASVLQKEGEKLTLNPEEEQLELKPEEQNYRTKEENDATENKISNEMSMGFQGEGVTSHFDAVPLRVQTVESLQESREGKKLEGPELEAENQTFEMDTKDESLTDKNLSTVDFTENIETEGANEEETPSKIIEATKDETIQKHEQGNDFLHKVEENLEEKEGKNIEGPELEAETQIFGREDTNDENKDVSPNEEVKESNLQSQEKDLQMAPTEKTETVVLRDDNSDLILDASPTTVKTTEETLQVGDPLEKTSNVGLEEQTHETIDDNKKDIEVAAANISSQEGHINVELKDTFADLVPCQETTDLSKITKDTIPSVNETLVDSDTLCVAHASVLQKEGQKLKLNPEEEQLELKPEEQNYGTKEENDITENKISNEMSMGFQGEGVTLHFDTVPLRVQTVESLQEGREGKKLEGPESEAENQTFEMDTKDESVTDKNLSTVDFTENIETEGVNKEETPSKIIETTKDETIEKHEQVPTDQNHETNVEEEATKINVSTGAERTERFIDISPTSLASKESSKNEEISNAGHQEERLGIEKQEESSTMVSEELNIAVGEEETVRGIIKGVDAVENLNNALSESRSVGVIEENDLMNNNIIPKEKEKASNLVSEEQSFQIEDSTEENKMEMFKDDEDICHIVDTYVAKIEPIKESQEKVVVAEKHAAGTNDNIDLDIPVKNESERLDINTESLPDMSTQKTEADMETTSIEISLDDGNPIDVLVYPQASLQENSQNEAFPVTTEEHSKEVEEVSTTKGEEHEAACELDSVDNSENIEAGENNEEEMIERRETLNNNPAENRTGSEQLEKPTHMVLEGVEKIDEAESKEKQINTVPVGVVVEEVTDEEKNVVTNLDQGQIDSRPKDQNYKTEEANDTTRKEIPNEEVPMILEGDKSALDLNTPPTQVDGVEENLEEKKCKKTKGPDLEAETHIFGTQDENDIKDGIPTEEAEESNLQSQERDLQMAPTEKTETVTLRDDDKSDLILDASPAIIKTTEETLQVGDQFEKASDVRLEEQIHEAIDENEKDIEVAKANISSQEGQINVEFKDTYHDLVSAQETTNVSDTTKATTPSVNEALGDADTSCVAHASVLHKEGETIALDLEEELELKLEEQNYGTKEENDITENKISDEEMSMGLHGKRVALHLDTIRVDTVESLQEDTEGKKTEGPELEAENQIFEMKDDIKDVTPSEEVKESNLHSSERNLQIFATEKTETVLSRDAEHSNLIVDASPATNKSPEETYQEVGDKLEKSDIGWNEQIQKASNANENDLELSTTNMSSQEQINFEKLKDPSADLASSQEPDSHNGTAKAPAPSLTVDLGGTDDTDDAALRKPTVETNDWGPGETSEIEKELKEAKHDEASQDRINDKQIEDVAEDTTEEINASDSSKVRLSDLLEKSKRERMQMGEDFTGERKSTADEDEPQNKQAEAIRVEEQKTEEEKDELEEEEHKKDDSGSDAPVIVEAIKDAELKPGHKKSHNILSGVGSKVKHSISKVKKAIIGKSSHPKSLSPK